ncbi:MAG: hypothetical protein HOP08_16080 [Cyclobacteriaceae bacterium]|nr:hypothetical protein [Cyclobacteriaceae bacterium]
MIQTFTSRSFSVLFCLLISLSLVSAQNVSLTVQTGHAAAINRLIYSPNGALLASAGSDNRIVIWDISAGKQLLTFSGHTLKVNDISFHPNNNMLASVSDDGRLILWDLAKGISTEEYDLKGPLKSVCFSPDGSSLAVAGKEISIMNVSSKAISKLPFYCNKDYYSTVTFSHDGKFIAFAGRKISKVRIVDIATGAVVKNLNLKTNQLAFSKDDTYLVGAGVLGKLKRWNIRDDKPFSTYTLPAPQIWQSYLSTAISDEYFASGNKNDLISVYGLTSGVKIHVLNGHNSDVNAVAFSPDNKTMVSSGMDKNIVFWDLTSGEIVKVLRGTAEKINVMEFMENGKSIVLGYDDGSFRYWQMDPGGEMIFNSIKPKQGQQFKGYGFMISDVYKIENKKVTLECYYTKRLKRRDNYAKIERYWLIWDLETNTYKKRLRNVKRPKMLYDSLLKSENLVSKDSTRTGMIASAINGRKIKLVDPKNPSTAREFTTDHSDRITSVKFNPQAGYLATASLDGLIKLWDVSTGKMLTNVMASNENDYMFITTDNYYFSTKGALANVGFKVGSEIYSFEQFDLKFNRPDLVLEKLNYADTALAFAYYKAYEKRIQKSGAAMQQENFFNDIPEIKSTTNDKIMTSRSKEYHFTVEGKSAKTPLDKLFVLINGVPLYGKGITVDKQTFSKDVSIELSYGVNKIQYYVTNEKGISSLQKTFQISYKQGRVKPDLYLVTIGASTYKQNEFDLKYAAKDAQDIEALFKNSSRFNEVKQVSLLNENVTSDNIIKLKDFLLGARVDDVVLISYSGHGLLDKNMEYYLSTHTVDFNDPSKGGLPFTEMENLLESIRSRNKFLIVDACHSGEIDKDEVELTSASASEVGEISFRSVGAGVKNKSGAGLKTSFELSKVLFADSKNTHGAVVVSSAGGGEYAIEGKEWKNGIFTYCFINGLKNKKADLNKDGSVSIAELQRYLSREVPRLTKGKQTPTSRDENLNNNFIIW